MGEGFEPYFVRSGRVVSVRSCDPFILESAMGTVDPAWIEGFDCFRAQLHVGDYLSLDRRAPNLFRILGIVQRGSILHEVYDIAFGYGLEFGFSEAVEAEVAHFIESEPDWRGCEDLRSIPFVTVDGVGTRDLDQALYVGTREDGFWQGIEGTQYVVWYAIADAAWFVQPKSAIYEEALRRGSSIYFAGMSVPMLPHAFSQGIVSLNAGVDRRALVFIMEIDDKGVCLRTTLKRARIHSRAKLVTEDVSAFLRDPSHHAWKNAEFCESLKNLKRVGLLRLAESRTRNVVHFNRVALDVGLNRQKTEFVVGLDERLDVDMYNEQLSLLCNIEGATILKRFAEDDPEVLAIFRNHEAPSLHAVDEVFERMMAIVRAQDMPECWYWHRERDSLADYFEQLPRESLHSDFEASPEVQKQYRVRQALERQVLMMQRRSVFSPDAGLHSALGVNPYGRFSAPMREIVGIFTHQEAIDAEFDGDREMDRETKRVLRERVIEASNRAKTLQNNVDKAIDSCAIAHVISHDYDIELAQRPHRRGTILGMKSSALYVRLDMPPIELKVYIRDMVESTQMMWSLNEEMTVLSSENGDIRYAVGDSIELVVSTYEPQKKKWRVVPVMASSVWVKALEEGR